MEKDSVTHHACAPLFFPVSAFVSAFVRANAVFQSHADQIDIGANAEDLTQKQRDPPPDPTPIRLPTTPYTPASPAYALNPSTWHKLKKHIAALRQPQDVTTDLLDLLNVNLIPNTSFADLLPDPSPFDAFNECDYVNRSDRDECDRLLAMTRELGHSNDIAFKSLLRLAEDHEKVTLSQARRFWSGLEHMSQYWDTSADDYYEVIDEPSATTIPGTETRPPAKSDDSLPRGDFMSSNNIRQYTIEFARESDEEMEDDEQDEGKEKKEVKEEAEEEEWQPRMKRVYRGRRTGTGREMHEEFRDEMLKGFVESMVWTYGCQVVKPIMHPRLAVGTMLLPMKQTFVVGRSPKERVAARRGVLEGPVLGVLGRGVIGYWIDGPWPELEGNKAETYDLLREVGAMLELAQQRAREGKKETRPGAGKWWATKRRWGGGPGGPMGYEDDLQKEYYIEDGEVKCVKAKKRPLSEAVVVDKVVLPENVEEASQEKEEKASIPTVHGASSRKKSSRESRRGVKPGTILKRWNIIADRWRLIQPGSSLWDDQRVYMRIGKQLQQPQATSGTSPTETFDNVFLISSMNHHISILRMRVSDRYLAWLQQGELDEPGIAAVAPDESSQAQHGKSGVLEMWRTKWYDLFIPEERLEALKGLWQVMAWLVKKQDSKSHGEK